MKDIFNRFGMMMTIHFQLRVPMLVITFTLSSFAGFTGRHYLEFLVIQCLKQSSLFKHLVDSLVLSLAMVLYDFLVCVFQVVARWNLPLIILPHLIELQLGVNGNNNSLNNIYSLFSKCDFPCLEKIMVGLLELK